MHAKGIFLELVQNNGNNKSFKMLPELVQSGPGAIFMFEIVKKCKISLPAKDQLSGERYRTVGPLAFRKYRKSVFFYSRYA